METIRTYLDNLFAGLPEDERLSRAKEELLSTMEDKYNSLKAEGKSENEAIGVVISEFGNIDELLEELEIGRSNAAAKSEDTDNAVRVTEEQVREYLRSTQTVGWMAGIGVLLVLVGVASLVVINSWLGDHLGMYHISGVAGVVSMLLFIACGVVLFITSGVKSDNYKQYVTQAVLLPEAVKTSLADEHKKSRTCLGLSIGFGVALIIAGVCVLVLLGSFDSDTMGSFGLAVMLVMIGLGVMLMCAADGREDGYKHLLNIDKNVTVTSDGKKVIKKKNRAVAIFEAILWPVTVIVYFIWSFIFDGWAISWIVFPIAGIINGCVSNAVSAYEEE